MPSLRFKALEKVQSRSAVAPIAPSSRISDYYAKNVFTMSTMKNYLTKEAFQAVLMAIEKGEKIDRSVADRVASGMKLWALDRGVTHYTHWFQPLTGATAEKHDSFFEPDETGAPVEKFTGGALVQQEPDASSFPSGGLRNTFEARGYTAWDPSSPAFIMENSTGKTLCIPTIFVSFTGDALDYKAPLLKALHFLETAVVDVCSTFFDKNVTKAHASLGIEQEYFLIDEAFYYARPDLLLSGRTLLGYPPAKGQQLDDHYFGSIPDRSYAFMLDFEAEALKLGIPLKTRHNEVAPSQFECAPMFEEINLAIDHNQLLMDLMEKVAKKHSFKVLLHEKPFADINGSGKHNNWSIITNNGTNLLSPGKTPEKNIQFITFFINTIKAVNDNADLLRASIADAGNDHRLGANEAPPAIISIFIGSQLTQMLHELEKPAGSKKGKKNAPPSIDVHQIPEILVDNTDRNRTSPFAFTGNKFELRAVGSSANSSSPMVVLNTAMANQLNLFKKDVLAQIKKGSKQDDAILIVLKKYIKASSNILFEGNGYGDEWVKEAEKRGLSNTKNTPEALKAYVSDISKDLFIKNKIFTERELYARYEIRLDDYINRIDIESKVISEMANGHVIPAALEYQKKLAQNVLSLKSLGMDAQLFEPQKKIIEKISKHINAVRTAVSSMIEARREADNTAETDKKAETYCNKVKPFFDIIRNHSDELEFIVEDQLWTLPKYQEMLFIR